MIHLGANKSPGLLIGVASSREDDTNGDYGDVTWPGLRHIDSAESTSNPHLCAANDQLEVIHSEKNTELQPDPVITSKNPSRTRIDNNLKWSHHESIASNARSDKSKRAQPVQGSQKNIRSANRSIESIYRDSERSPYVVPQSRDIAKRRPSNQRGGPGKKHAGAATTERPQEGTSSLTRTLNMVSSDTIIDRNASPVIKARRASYVKTKTTDNFQRINKIPYKEASQRINVYMPTAQAKPTKVDVEAKHSAHGLHRERIPSIAQQFKIQTEMSRFNLKTREELVSKKQLLNSSNKEERFDVSVDLSPGNHQQSGYATVRTGDLYRKKGRNNKIESNFLKQSEIMRIRPDGFRRISIQTDIEFGMTHGQGQNPAGGAGLQPLSNTNTIVEDERVIEDEEDERGSMRGMTESLSSSLLPKKRRLQKTVKITDSVLQSRHESQRLSEILSQQ